MHGINASDPWRAAYDRLSAARCVVNVNVNG